MIVKAYLPLKVGDHVRRNQVGLVQNDDLRYRIQRKIAEDLCHRFDLVQSPRVRSIDDMHQQIAVRDLFERGSKRGDERLRKIADKSYGVVNDHFLFERQPQTSRGRVERREHSFLGMDLGLRQRVQQRRLTRVRVPHERDDRQILLRADLAALLSLASERIDLTLELSRVGLSLVGFGFLIVLPLAFLVTGGVIWWRRRKT